MAFYWWQLEKMNTMLTVKKKKKKNKKQNTNLEFYIQCNYPLSVEEYFII